MKQLGHVTVSYICVLFLSLITSVSQNYDFPESNIVLAYLLLLGETVLEVLSGSRWQYNQYIDWYANHPFYEWLTRWRSYLSFWLGNCDYI